MMMLEENSKECEGIGQGAGICCHSTTKGTWDTHSRFAAVLLLPPSAIKVSQSISVSNTRQMEGKPEL